LPGSDEKKKEKKMFFWNLPCIMRTGWERGETSSLSV